MTSKNSILLIISQNPGITYSDLLSKIAPNYSNLNSSRAALSRVLKDAISFGMVQKKDHQLFVTDKGQANVKVKMHDKLVLKLNQLMKVRSIESNPGPLVQHLSILLERSKVDPRLLDNARAGVSFSIADIEKVHEDVQAHLKQMQYLEQTMHAQIASLKELNFPASKHLTLTELQPKLAQLISTSNAQELHVDYIQEEGNTHPAHVVLDGLPYTPKGNRALLPLHHLHDVLQHIQKVEPTHPGIKAHVGLFTLDVKRDAATVRGPSHLIEGVFREEKKYPLAVIEEKKDPASIDASPTDH